jgi:hypothetical protein
MHVTKHLPSIMRLKLTALASIFLLPSLGLAQDTSQAPGQSNPSAQDSSKKTDNSSSEPASPIGLAWADTYIHQIGSSGLLAGSREGIGWGSLYIPAASVTGVVDRFEPTGTLPGTTFDSAVLQTSVIYDHTLPGGSRLAVQYAPSVAFANGQVVGNFSNQNTSLDILIYTRPRWNVRFGDTFSYYYAQQSYGRPYFDVNPVTAGSVTNNFLNGPNSWLSNSAYLSVAYALSMRSSISITPTFVYSESGVGMHSSHAGSYGGNVNWNYRTSRRQTVGIQYTGQLIHETFPVVSTPPGGTSSDTLYHTIAATVSRQLSATWFVSGALGTTTSTFSQTGQTAQNARQWSFYGSGGLVKQLKRSTVGVNYSRGDTLSNGLISNQYADRFDITYRNQITKRLNGMVGWGYLRQIQSGGFSGWYASSDVQFLLSPRAGVFAFFDYSRTNQSVNTNNLYAGNSDYFSFGIRWQPGRIAH